MKSKLLFSLILPLSFAVTALGQPAPTPTVEVVPLKLPFANAFLVKAANSRLLVDCGTNRDWDSLIEGLSQNGLKPQDIPLLILTHAHADHVGLAKKFHEAGVKIAAGKGDINEIRAGRIGELKPVNWLAHLLKIFAPTTFEPLEPDILIDNDFDLSPLGIPGKILSTPGHTPGSLSIVLADHSAIIGDMLMGGVLGGIIFPRQPAEPYFVTDRKQNLNSLSRLIQIDTKTFYVGHGGPLAAADILDTVVFK